MTRIQVKHADGTKEWVDINEDIPRNKYDLSKLTYQKPLMNYYEDGKLVSKCGVDISANQGDVDFSKLKSAGCDFVMLKVGARGYSSGNIVSDKNFEDNLKAAKKAGLDIGVYFCSQAVSKSEAREEADEVLDAISGYSVKYPVVFVMENVDEDMLYPKSIDNPPEKYVKISFNIRGHNDSNVIARELYLSCAITSAGGEYNKVRFLNYNQMDSIPGIEGQLNIITRPELRLPPRGTIRFTNVDIILSPYAEEDFLLDGVIGADRAAPQNFRIYIPKNKTAFFCG